MERQAKSTNLNSIKEKTWDEFREAGMLWVANRVLQLFGWTILCDTDENNKVTGVRCIRTKEVGFDLEFERAYFKKVAKYMRDNSTEIFDNLEDIDLNEKK